MSSWNSTRAHRTNSRRWPLIDSPALCPLVWPTDAESLKAVANFRRLHLSSGLGLIDALIAAAALSLGVPLCTFNVKHFRHVPGLVTEQPYLR